MIAGIILAAGASSRMGRTKALLPVGNDCFATRLVRTFADAGIGRVVVVCADDIATIRRRLSACGLPAEIVANPQRDEGQLSSLRVGLAALAAPEPEAIAVSPVDMPLVSVETIRTLLDRWRHSRAPVVRPARAGRHGHPVIFDRAVFGELREAEVRAGARVVIRAHATEAVDVAVDDEGAFQDIDTPEDYARLIGSASGT